MNLSRRSRLFHLFTVQVLMGVLCTVSVKCCNFGPGNLGIGNIGVGNIGLFNFGLLNGGLGNKGFWNFGIRNTGFSQLGLRNIGALNFIPFPNTISVFNIPVAPNLSPPGPVFGRRRRRRSTMNYPEGKFPWLKAQTLKQENKDTKLWKVSN